MTEGEESFVLVSGAEGAARLREMVEHSDNIVMLKTYRNFREMYRTLEEMDLLDPGHLYQPLRPGGRDSGGEPAGLSRTALALSIHDHYQKERQGLLTTAYLTGSGWGRWLLLLLVGLVVAAYWLGLWPEAHRLSVQKLYRQLAWPLLRLLLYLGVGLLLGQAIESLGWAAKLGSWAAPLLRWGHLRKECGASFTAAFFSGILANTMLVTLYQEGRISRQELTITYLLNSALPVFLLHLPTTFFIILPLTRQAGLIYLGLTLSAGGAPQRPSHGLFPLAAASREWGRVRRGRAGPREKRGAAPGNLAEVSAAVFPGNPLHHAHLCADFRAQRLGDVQVA